MKMGADKQELVNMITACQQRQAHKHGRVSISRVLMQKIRSEGQA